MLGIYGAWTEAWSFWIFSGENKIEANALGVKLEGRLSYTVPDAPVTFFGGIGWGFFPDVWSSFEDLPQLRVGGMLLTLGVSVGLSRKP